MSLDPRFGISIVTSSALGLVICPSGGLRGPSLVQTTCQCTMAEDARFLLQSERNARKIKHPYLAYTSKGQLLCNICHSFIKSNNLWETHLRSDQHLLRLKQLKIARTTSAESDLGPVTKKRKTEEDGHQQSKRSRKGSSDEVGDAQEPVNQDRKTGEPLDDIKMGNADQVGDGAIDYGPALDTPKTETPNATVDPNEWSAFERDIAGLGKVEIGQPTTSAFDAAPIIVAAPLSTAQLAAQARYDLSMQKERRLAEMEDEKEDASKQKVVEMSRMAELERKMKIWRGRREETRKVQKAELDTNNVERASASDSNKDAEDGAEGEQSSDEYFDEWGGFGGSTLN